MSRKMTIQDWSHTTPTWLCRWPWSLCPASVRCTLGGSQRGCAPSCPWRKTPSWAGPRMGKRFPQRACLHSRSRSVNIYPLCYYLRRSMKKCWNFPRFIATKAEHLGFAVKLKKLFFIHITPSQNHLIKIDLKTSISIPTSQNWRMFQRG